MVNFLKDRNEFPRRPNWKEGGDHGSAGNFQNCVSWEAGLGESFVLYADEQGDAGVAGIEASGSGDGEANNFFEMPDV
jgi:hypothetical protein